MSVMVQVNPAWRGGTPQGEANIFAHTSATWKAGEFLKCVAGLLKQCTTSVATGVGADAVQYQAFNDLDAAIGDSTTKKRVGVVAPTDIYEMNILTGSWTMVQIGLSCGINVTSNLDTVVVTEVTHVVCKIVHPLWDIRPRQDSSSDTLGPAYVSILADAINAIAA